MTKSKISRKLVSGIGAFAIIAAACGSGSTNDTYSDDEPSSASADGDPADNAENEGSSSNQSTDASQSVADSEEQIQSVDDFEDYAIGQGLPENWSTYGNASGDIDLVAAGDDTSSETQTGDSQILSWSFDANADPGFGGIRKDFSKPQNWTGFTGIQFLFRWWRRRRTSVGDW